jgi:hypothetical protein
MSMMSILKQAAMTLAIVAVATRVPQIRTIVFGA